MIRACERTIRLQPGDMLITGTPRGVGLCLDPPKLLETGQRVRIEVDGLGWIEHEVVDEKPAVATADAAIATA